MSFTVLGQREKDSLIQLLNEESNPVQKFKICYNLIQITANFDSIEYKNWKDKAWSLANNIDSDSLRLKMHQIEGIPNSFNNNDQKRIEHVIKGIKLSEKLKDSVSLAGLNYSLGAFYFWKQNPDLATKYMKQAMISYPEKGNPLKKATYTMAYGVVLQNTDPQGAVKYHEEALAIKRKANAWKHIPISLNNLAELKVDLGDTLKGIELLKESIHLSNRHGIKDAEVYAEFILGEIYNDQKKYSKALPLISKSVHWWEENNSQKDLPRAYKELTRSFTGVGDHRASAKVWKKYVDLSEKLFEKDRLNAIQELETKYETEKKEIALEEEKKEKDLAQKETELIKANQKTRLILFSIIGVLLIGGGVYVYTLYRKQKKDKNTIEEQKVQLEVRNKEVEDSIKYAKRIQNAILPRDSKMQSMFPEHFVLYKPKDIIAGDFYWVHENEKEEKILLAAADCTGHGVPGAMVSVVCNNGLNRSVREFELSNPADILNKTRELVIEEFEKSKDDVKDGMDIALISIEKPIMLNRQEQKKSGIIPEGSGSILSYAGAHNPLWLIRSGQNQIEEVKADKQPIGRYHDSKPFTSHEVNVNKGDTIYVFSDGYADQFGGEKGKKLKAANLKKLLIEISAEPLQKQKELLEDAFKTWKGDLEQLDDVCLIGVRV